MTNRCVIYTRVSKDNQTTDNRLIELKRVAELKGLTIVYTFTDEGISVQRVGILEHTKTTT